MSTVLANDPRQPQVGRTLWLQTSPEFGMKRLLATALAIYQITRADFRNAEIGPLHNPEFTIVEWYRVDDDMQAGMSLLSDFCQVLLGTSTRRTAQLCRRIRALRERQPARRQRAGVSRCRPAARHQSSAAIKRLATTWLNLLLAGQIKPNLGKAKPTILYDYPASQTAFAKRARKIIATIAHQTEPVNYSVAERFELYFRGFELANGYHELLDATELGRPANQLANVARQKDSKPACRNKADYWRPCNPVCQHAPVSRWASIGSRCWPLAQKTVRSCRLSYRSSLGGIAYAGKLRMASLAPAA